MAKAKKIEEAAETGAETPPLNPFDVLVATIDPLSPQPATPALAAAEAPPEPQAKSLMETTPEDAPEAPAVLVKLGADAYADLVQPSGTFSDDPPPGWEDPVPQSPQDADPVASARASLQGDAARALGGEAIPPPTTSVPVTSRGSRAPDIRQALARAAASPNATKYRSRVTIGAAYQYDGRLHQAPDWVDRNWAAYDEGPAINVPDIGIVRAGQWVVTQEVLDDDGRVSFTELKVYDDGVFKSLFMVNTDG